MLKRIVVFACLFFMLPLTAAKLSESSFLSLLTVSPGNELYSTFGHSGIRVCDSANNIDYVFNYGTFDFNTPNFYMKFARGKLDYCLSIQYFSYFLMSNNEEKRSTTEQVLNFSQTEKQKLFDLLVENYQVENRYYRYSFFYDNCATRIRDIVDNAVDDTLFVNTNSISDRPFRSYLREYLKKSPWEHVGIDIVLGIPCDKKASGYESTFLPDYLHNEFAKAKRSDNKPLVAQERVLASFKTAHSTILMNPVLALSIILLVLSLITLNDKSASKALDISIFSVTSVAGILICFLWFFSIHETTKLNMNILWALPTNIFAYFFIQKPIWRKYYFGAVAVLSVIILILCRYPQYIHTALLPFIAAIVVRSAHIYSSIKNSK